MTGFKTDIPRPACPKCGGRCTIRSLKRSTQREPVRLMLCSDAACKYRFWTDLRGQTYACQADVPNLPRRRILAPVAAGVARLTEWRPYPFAEAT